MTHLPITLITVEFAEARGASHLLAWTMGSTKLLPSARRDRLSGSLVVPFIDGPPVRFTI
jgi:hypothetical protein